MAKTASCALVVGLFVVALLGSCGLAESIAEGFVDDQDVVIPAGGGLYGTAVQAPDGTDGGVERDVLRPGDRASDAQALAVVAFAIDPSRQPDKTRLEWVRLRVWLDPGAGDVSSLGPLVVSHLKGVSEEQLGDGLLPDLPGTDLQTIEDVAPPGWREVDVSAAFLEDWNAGRNVSAFVLRFATPSDGDGADDDVDLDPETGGEDRRIHVVLHFGVDL